MKSIAVLWGVAVFAALFTGVSSGAVEPQMIADFNMPPPNNVGGGYGAFAPSAEELTFVTVESMDEVVRRGAVGASMRLDYNVEKAGAFNGFWMKLGGQEMGNNFDATQYTKLSFWIKGDSKVGVPKKFKIELKGDPGTPIGRKYIGEVKDEWTKVEIPLSDYKQQRVVMSNLNEMVIVFENMQVMPGCKGSIWVDDICLEP